MKKSRARANVNPGVLVQEIGPEQDGAKILFQPNSAMQSRVLTAMEDEILVAGSKMGGKTYVATAWEISGNPDKDNSAGPFFYDIWYGEDGQPHSCAHGTVPGATPLSINASYIFHPNYFSVVVRKNQSDLEAWINQNAIPLFTAGPFYGIYKTSPYPGYFHFPLYGSMIMLGHLKDAASYMQYQGVPELHRFYIDEGGQIGDEKTWNEIRSCIRSSHPELRAQLLISANPGGPGQIYLKNRFMKPINPNTRELLLNTSTGEPYKPGETIVETVTDPRSGKLLKRTRVWVQSYTWDNPSAPEEYIANLLTLDEKQKQLYYYGNWDAYSGCYFDNFTETHHITQEMPPWWSRHWGGMDWGFSHEAVLLIAGVNPSTGQWIVCDEMVISGLDPESLGMEVARKVQPYIPLVQPEPFVIFLSHDAFGQKTGEITLADLLQKGINRILGPDGCYVPETIIRSMRESAKRGGTVLSAEVQQYHQYRQEARITLVRHQPARVAEAQYVRGLFSRDNPTPASEPDYLALVKATQQDGVDGYKRYLAMFPSQKSAVYPRLLIHDRCVRLRDAIPRAVHDDANIEDIDRKHFTGMDCIDALKYTCKGYQNWVEQMPPTEVRARQIFEQYVAQHGAKVNIRELADLQEAAQRELEEQTDQPFTIRGKRNILYPGGEWG